VSTGGRHIVPRPERRARRPGVVTATIWVLGFLGITALAGGLEMLVFVRGNPYLPASMLDEVPLLDTWLLPGLALAFVFGIGSLIGMWGMARQPKVRPLAAIERRTSTHWSWAWTVAVGYAFTAWMAIEIALLGFPWEATDTAEAITAWVLYGIYVTVALLLLGLPRTRGVRDHLLIEEHIDLEARLGSAAGGTDGPRIEVGASRPQDG
jgi:hypothetical protein